ncbi:MAG: hypothetical protein AAF846_28650 [Chloroflexota bacterium]
MAYPKYQVNDEAELQGMALQLLMASKNLYDFEDLVQKYEYDEVDPEGWYSFQTTLDFLKELTERHNSTQNMVSIGMKLYDVMPLPPEAKTIEDGLHLFNSMNKVVQRGVMPERDWYTVEVIDDTHITFTDTGVYPHDLVYGEVYSVAKRLRPEGKVPVVTREYMNEDDPDSDGAIYHIRLDSA